MEEISQVIRHESRVVIREYMHKTEHGHFIDVLYLLAQHRDHSRYIRPERSHYRPPTCDLSPSPDNGSPYSLLNMVTRSTSRASERGSCLRFTDLNSLTHTLAWLRISCEKISSEKPSTGRGEVEVVETRRYLWALLNPSTKERFYLS